MEFYFNSPSFQPAGEQHTLLLEGVREAAVKWEQKRLLLDPLAAPGKSFTQDRNLGGFPSSVLTT